MRLRVLLAFAAIYLVWGSTYLAIRYAVAEIPPFLTAGLRHLIAGAVLFTWVHARGHRASAREWAHSAVVGVLFFLIGHGTLHWAEQTVPSGLAALLVATEPMWIALLLAAIGASRFRMRTLPGLVLGLVGVWALLGPAAAGGGAHPLGVVAVIVGTASWSVGVVYSQRATLPQDPTLRTATTLLWGAAFLLIASAVAGELQELRPPSMRAIGSLAYLIVFGSIVAFTAYYWLLDRYPATLVATHTYVNPAVAVLLGWAFAGETVSATLLLGLVLIAASIALVGTETGGITPARAANVQRPAGASTATR